MRVFLTGATGFIGTYIIPELLQSGHQVIGVTRSEEGANTLRAAGVEPFMGTLEDPAGLARGAAQADGVIHCAFDHNFTNFAANCEKDRAAISAIGEVLKGSDRPFLVTSGVGIGSSDVPGEPATEDRINLAHPNPRTASEQLAVSLVEQGVNLSVIRLPQVHDTVKQGLITYFLTLAREKGYVAYLGEGQNRWSAAHVTDTARLYRLALDKATPGARYNAVAEEGVPARDICEVLGQGLKMPVKSLSTQEEISDYYGWMAMFAGMDLPASSEQTRKALDWTPTGPDLITDLKNMQY
ncbi:nucleoside-diphosphate-sugar epimerase [Terriglobus roseus DSM 18391]|uniref:Nucleoside-diphosphate-sugar epimerase n=1 Tax=Terriglobus roseus (strain DSM 18391 / NRRL B-41598 / KBS 63) TaxID=926566 RepID=I3ZL23_TERRK|nr:SDR family oxidoreductase [Terriglobus roseus]AFL89941.1 nucleoside-diphosphate-sugar epimerase [Terriglobus roseus DSM 18391]